MSSLYSDVILHIYEDSYVLEPLPLEEERCMLKPQCMVISRSSNAASASSGELSVSEVSHVDPNTPAQRVLHTYGLLGVLYLQGGAYLVVISGREFIGSIRGQSVFRLTKATLYPFASSTAHLTERQRRYESTYVSIIESLLGDKYFYFSYTLDLFNCMQKLLHLPDDVLLWPLHRRLNKQFFWNAHMLQPLDHARMDKFMLPVMRGYVHIAMFMVNDLCFDFVLISRRSRHRAGTRYQTRGVDSDGRVANKVETEQLLSIGDSWSSFVQTRGSIPLYWGQKTNLKYNPRTRITHSADETLKAFSYHFERELRAYTRQLIVNLLDRKGDELKLSQAFEHYLERLHSPQIDYVYFDFHAQTKNGQFENVSQLQDKVADRVAAIGFTRTTNGVVDSLQCGAVRTNCLDCLDRTNLVQSTFARQSLMLQLRSFGVTELDPDGLIDRSFKEAWANNGDAISLQYAGTGALKSDFTRTGKRKTKGVIKDGVNAISRYYINNFQDSLRQIAMDLLLGVSRVESIDMSVMEEEESKKDAPAPEEVSFEFEAWS